MKRIVSSLIVTLLFLSLFAFAFNVQTVKTVSSPVVVSSSVHEGSSSITLPAGADTYLYGYGTGGGLPSGDFAYGQYTSLTNAAGYLVASLAVTTSNSNYFSTSSGYPVIGGVGVQGFLSYTCSFGSNNAPAAPSASDSFTVSVSGSLVVVIAIGGDEQSLSVSGLPNLQIDASWPGSPANALQILHTYLDAGQYNVTEYTSQSAGGQDPAHAGDLIGVFAFTPVESNPAPDKPYNPDPPSGATDVPTSIPLAVNVTHPKGGSMNVSFYEQRVGSTPTENFTIIALPDTQIYSESHAEIFDNQTQWIVNNAPVLNIVFVTHEGDIVNDAGYTYEWNNANHSMSILESGNMQWGVLPGNHDQQDGTVNYNTYFGRDRFLGKLWYGGSYQNSNNNNFELFSGGKDGYLIFHFECEASDSVLAWANATLALYPHARVIVTTHEYLKTDGSRETYGEGLYQKFIRPHADQVFLVLCGHNHGEALKIDNVNGHNVYQLLADYQDYTNGGNGFLRIMKFHPAEGKIYVETYSPYLNQYETDSDSQFTLDYSMTNTGSSLPALIGEAFNIESGGKASITWSGLNYSTTYYWYAVATDSQMNSNQSDIWSFTTAGSAAPTDTVYINGDGSVSPSYAPISSLDNVTYTLTGNIRNPAYNGIAVERNNLVIDGNGYTVQGNQSGIGINLTDTSNVTIKNTNIMNFYNGIYLTTTANIVIFDNNVTTSSYDGIELQSSSNITISGNNLTDAWNGIELIYSSQIIVFGNNVMDAQSGGIVLSGTTWPGQLCSFNTVSGNKVTENGNGIWLIQAVNSTISNNDVSSNNANGIYLLWASGNNTFSDNNVIANSGVGIKLWGTGGGNLFYGNNFINNSQQVSSDQSPNVWDYGYPSGGNYWSDYTGLDQKCGPSQDHLGSDGMGDTPYTIDANNQDRYPLMKPFPWDQHDIGITRLSVSKTVVAQGYDANVSMMLFNYGQDTETFNVTAYANETMPIDTVSIELAGRTSTTVNLTWNTTGFAKGNYSISAYASPVPGETRTEDNTFIGDTVLVTIPGDINGDQYVNAKDAVMLGGAFYPAGTYNPNADINSDDWCNAKDATILGTYFGQHWP